MCRLSESLKEQREQLQALTQSNSKYQVRAVAASMYMQMQYGNHCFKASSSGGLKLASCKTSLGLCQKKISCRVILFCNAGAIH